MTQVLLALIAGVAAGGIVVFVVVIQLAKVEAARMSKLDKALRTEMTPPSKPRHLQPVPDDDPPPTGAA